jgi:hypothetical protein
MHSKQRGTCNGGLCSRLVPGWKPLCEVWVLIARSSSFLGPCSAAMLLCAVVRQFEVWQLTREVQFEFLMLVTYEDDECLLVSDAV